MIWFMNIWKDREKSARCGWMRFLLCDALFCEVNPIPVKVDEPDGKRSGTAPRSADRDRTGKDEEILKKQ